MADEAALRMGMLPCVAGDQPGDVWMSPGVGKSMVESMVERA